MAFSSGFTFYKCTTEANLLHFSRAVEIQVYDFELLASLNQFSRCVLQLRGSTLCDHRGSLEGLWLQTRHILQTRRVPQPVDGRLGGEIVEVYQL